LLQNHILGLLSMLTEQIEIINKLGLHARAAAKFVGTATRFESAMKIRKDDREVDGKSIMSVMMLAASCGSTIEIVTDGPDEEPSMIAIKELINDKFGEGE
jgi:phosphocarrier protein